MTGQVQSSRLRSVSSDRPRARPALGVNCPNVLVIGLDPTMSWVVTRSLPRAGFMPFVIGRQRATPLKWLPDCRRYYCLSVPDFDEQVPRDLVSQLDDIARRHGAEIAVAADYAGNALLARCGRHLTQARACAVAEFETLRLLNDKWQFSRLLERLGLPYPETELACSAAELLATRLPFPIITKPPDRWASVGFQIHRTRESLLDVVRAQRLGSAYPLIVQRYIPGWDVGFSFLAQGGSVVVSSMWQHKRDGERIIYHDPRLREVVEPMLAATRYDGVGHVDGRYDPATDEYRLLEINPRFWASLLYTTNAGVNYAEELVRMGNSPVPRACRARPGRVTLGAYDRAMTLAVRLFEQGAEKLRRPWAPEP